jgi:hypothetical protein
MGFGFLYVTICERVKQSPIRDREIASSQTALLAMTDAAVGGQAIQRMQSE